MLSSFNGECIQKGDDCLWCFGMLNLPSIKNTVTIRFSQLYALNFGISVLFPSQRLDVMFFEIQGTIKFEYIMVHCYSF